jgi:hypothetical protein
MTTDRGRIGRRLLLAVGLAIGAGLPSPGARAQAGTEIRYMNLNDETVGGRRLFFADKTVISFFRNHSYEIAGPLHVGFYESGGKKPTRGRWDIRYGNTVYVTMEDASSKAYVFFKIGDKLHLRDTTGGEPGFGSLIQRIAPLN